MVLQFNIFLTTHFFFSRDVDQHRILKKDALSQALTQANILVRKQRRKEVYRRLKNIAISN